MIRALFLLLLTGDPIRFDANFRPQFTPNQITETSASTRAGLERWAATAEGQAILRRFQEADRTVIIREDPAEPTPGRAPQPSLETMLGANKRRVRKRYELVLNPTIASQYDNGSSIDLGLPRTASDVMALAWAGEMLHVDFYASGVPLPHHDRPDFQERWLTVAAQLGMPNATHGTEVPLHVLSHFKERSGRARRDPRPFRAAARLLIARSTLDPCPGPARTPSPS